MLVHAQPADQAPVHTAVQDGCVLHDTHGGRPRHTRGRGNPGDGPKLRGQVCDNAGHEPAGQPRTQRNLIGGLHERPPRTLRFQTGQPPLPDPDFQGLSAALDIPDTVDRAGLDPGRQHPAVRTGPFPLNRLDKNRPASTGTLGGEHNMAQAPEPQ